MTATPETIPQTPSAADVLVRAGDLPHQRLVRLLYGQTEDEDLPLLEALAQQAGVDPLDLIAATGEPGSQPPANLAPPLKAPHHQWTPGGPTRESAGDLYDLAWGPPAPSHRLRLTATKLA